VQQPNGTFEPILTGSPARYRGAAFGDFDNDGRIDAVVTRINEKPLFLRNTGAAGNHWLGLKLEGRTANRDAIGALINIKTAAGEQWNQVTTSVGYASSSDVRVHFGLGAAARATVEVRWPGGKVQLVGDIEANRYLTVKQP